MNRPSITTTEGIIWLLIALPMIILLVFQRIFPNIEWQSQLIPIAILIIINFSFWARQRLHLSKQDVFNENTQVRHQKIRLGVALVSTFFMGLMLFVRYGFINVEREILVNWTSGAGFLLFAWMGNYMLTIKQNEVFGILNIWTRKSEEVWKMTHKWTGKVWFLGGIVGFLITLAMPITANFEGFPLSSLIFFVFSFGSTIAAYAYSYFSYQKIV